MNYKAINFKEKYKLFKKRWSPRVIAEMNDYQFKLAKIKGDFQWHCHKDTDETFIVIQGSLQIKFKDGYVDLNEGEKTLLNYEWMESAYMVKENGKLKIKFYFSDTVKETAENLN